MYWTITLILFFTFPPLGAALLILGVAFNLLINLVDYVHEKAWNHKNKKGPRQAYAKRLRVKYI